MTSKERMLTATRLGQPDMVPVAPDTSNMIPCRLTGKPFWDIYLYQDPPLWKAYIDCCKHFQFDGWLPHAINDAMGQRARAHANTRIVFRNDERLITQNFRQENGKRTWEPRVTVFYRADPPTAGVDPAKIGLPYEPEQCWEIDGVRRWPTGSGGVDLIRSEMGEHGIIGGSVGLPSLGKEPERIVQYYDDREGTLAWAKRTEEQILRQLDDILQYDPDFVLIGVSGYLTLQSPQIARELGLSCLQNITRICRQRGVPTHLHCCGIERDLVEMSANETDLDLINPLEVPPMGDCDLAEVKQSFGDRIALMGNIHTTDPMLFGDPEEVAAAARKCIDAAAEGGGYILSTGDQCPRDTPDENLRALVETARDYGRY